MRDECDFTTTRMRSSWPTVCCFKPGGSEVAEAEAAAAMERCPMFGGVALRDLEREDRNTLSALFSGRLRGS
jgi:hypothetical protein